MKNLLLLFGLLFLVNVGLGQNPDINLKGVEQYYDLPYPERTDSVLSYLNSNKLPKDLSYDQIFEKELTTALERDESPLIIAEILGHKMRTEGQINDLILLAKTTTRLRKLIEEKGDLEIRAWKLLLGKTHIFSAHIAYYKYEMEEARTEMLKSIAIFEELEDSYLLSECYVEMSRYSEDDPVADAFYLSKLDSIAALIPMNRFIVSGLFFKMGNLTKAEKHQEMNQLIQKYEDSILITAPYLEYELKNQTAINAINLNDNEKAYDIYKSLVKELHNKEVIPVIFAQIEVVQNFTSLLKRMEKFKEASIYQDTLMNLLKREYTVLNDEAIAESQAKYSKLEDEQKIRDLELNRDVAHSKFKSTVFGLLLLFGTIISVIGFWIYRQRQKQHESFLLSNKEKETQEVREKLLTSITHELRTPLSIISAKLESLEETKSKEELHLHLDVAKRNSKQLVDQINQLLEWNKLEANALQNAPIIGDAELELEKIILELKPLASRKNLEWNIGVKEQNFKGKLDFQKFNTITRNLLSNAIKYSHNDEILTVKFFQDNSNKLILVVKDSGPGIPKEHLPKIFDWYYRVAANKNTAKYEGFGIGLALSKELAELMGGSISVVSEKEKGSTFTLSVPFENTIKEKSNSKQLTTASADSQNISKNKIEQTTILIIEDHPDLADHISFLFKDDFNVLVAHNFDQGKNMAEIEVPDLIISDIMLPDGTGLDLCKQLKSQMITDHIPIVMLTARGDEEIRFSSLENKADAFLTKPFNNKELRLTVQNLLQNRRILHLRFGSQTEDLTAAVDPFSGLVLQSLENNYSDSLFNVDAFAACLALSKGQAYRKIRVSFDSTPKKMIRNFRLEKAKNLLDNESLNISEIAYSCGFSTPEYFSTAFREIYKKSPSDFRAAQ